MLKENTIRSFCGEEIKFNDFVKEIKKASNDGFGAYVGTDSQQIKNKISVVTCVCLYKKGKSASKIFYVKERILGKRLPTLRSRMLHEAYKSVEAAIEIDPWFDGPLTVHLDIGSNPLKCKTAKFGKELKILVKSQGFGCEIKPDSWASSAVADRFTKT